MYSPRGWKFRYHSPLPQFQLSYFIMQATAYKIKHSIQIQIFLKESSLLISQVSLMDPQACRKSRYRITIVGDSKVGKKALCKQLDKQTHFFSPLERDGSYGYLPNGAVFNPVNYNDESTLYIFVFLYDLINLQSFTFVLDLYEKIKAQIRTDFIAFWVGNKRDLIDTNQEYCKCSKQLIDLTMKKRSVNFKHIFLSLKPSYQSVWKLMSDLEWQIKRWQKQESTAHFVCSKIKNDEGLHKAKQFQRNNLLLKEELLKQKKAVQHLTLKLKQKQQTIGKITQLNFQLQEMAIGDFTAIKREFEKEYRNCVERQAQDKFKAQLKPSNEREMSSKLPYETSRDMKREQGDSFIELDQVIGGEKVIERTKTSIKEDGEDAWERLFE